MSLSTSLQLAANALSTVQLGLQVTANNLANAQTPGYIREEAVLRPLPTLRQGNLLFGLGVELHAVRQKVDVFLVERLRAATSDLANTETQENAFLQLESILGELSDSDLSTSLTEFFASVNDVLNQPENLAIRNIAALQGGALSDQFHRIDKNVRDVRSDFNNQIVAAATDINGFIEEIAKLNVQIVSLEQGGLTASDAVGLRDQRLIALTGLASLLDIRTVEQVSGSVTVFTSGDFLVFNDITREVEVGFLTDRGLRVAEIHIIQTNAPVKFSSGKLDGLFTARDEILGNFLDQLDSFAQTLIFEFNRIHSSGQGLTGHSVLTSEFAVADAFVALDQLGLPFTPEGGSFQVLVRNKETGLTSTSDVFIDLDGLGTDTTANDLIAALDSIDGVSAAIDATGNVSISSDSEDLEFSFANDTSGILAALGLNTFFTGTTAKDIGVNSAIRADSTKFAVSRGGFGEDSENAVLLAGLFDAALDAQSGLSIANIYEQLVGNVAQTAAGTRAVSDGFRAFKNTLEGQHLAISGVNIDEEAINLIGLQRAFQASARVIT
ncbi:MAG: flagellar hook-associated protein FlgK, partial [Planctomycetes bacterium]|nr:flagellar hook-associated protein FlgK [Planctomycetota bacterium]